MATDNILHRILYQKVSIAPLVTFRILFGTVLFISVVRFWMNGWIEMQFIQPEFHFKYFGFHWLPEPSAEGYYVIFMLMALSALGIAAGFFYRWSAVLFFLAFTYIELIDVTYYLNHYYFVSVVALLLVFLPAHRRCSLDVAMGRVQRTPEVPAVSVNILKFQLGLVYFLAGFAKLNPEWLFKAMPLAIWLPAQSHLPLIGPLFSHIETAYAFSWAGAIYDLSIPFLLLMARTRWLAYVAVIVFHMLTWFLFQIGMFPFIMISATLIFFSPAFHEGIIGALEKIRYGWSTRVAASERATGTTVQPGPWLTGVVAIFVLFQLVFPFRHLLYPGNPFWHEQGYRFGWRVMLMEKAGYAMFRVTDTQGRTIEVDNRDFLTEVQEKMMSTQPDLMLQYASFLKEHYEKQGVRQPAVNARVYVTYNGRPSRPFIDPNVNLASLSDSWEHKTWILPLDEEGS